MPDLLFCESANRWMTKFRQFCPNCTLGVTQSSFDMDNLSNWLGNGELRFHAVIATEVGLKNADLIAKTLKELSVLRTDCRFVALTSRELFACNADLRSLGFIDVISQPLELPRLARLTQRHVSLLPERNQSWREKINERLPWQPIE